MIGDPADCRADFGYGRFDPSGQIQAPFGAGRLDRDQRAARRHTADFTRAYDVHTGEVKNEMDTASAFTRTHHHRCWRNKATCNYIIMGRTGVELISFDGKLAMQNAFTRGNCEYGVMPANGFIYNAPHNCACHPMAKLFGFNALAPPTPSRAAP